MARVLKEKISNMSGSERREYVENHPSEGLRFAEVSMGEAKYFGKKYAEYQKDRLVEVFWGKSLLINEPQE